MTPTEEPSAGRGGLIPVVVACILGSVVAILALRYVQGSGDEAKDPSPVATSIEATPTEPVVALVQPADAALPVEVITPKGASPATMDAAVATQAPPPVVVSPPPNKPALKAPPTLAALQKSVERIGGRLNTLAAELDKGAMDSLRRKWLDLATALPEVGNGADERRKFAAKVKRLNAAIKRASRNK